MFLVALGVLGNIPPNHRRNHDKTCQEVPVLDNHFVFNCLFGFFFFFNFFPCFLWLISLWLLRTCTFFLCRLEEFSSFLSNSSCLFLTLHGVVALPYGTGSSAARVFPLLTSVALYSSAATGRV
jgi:hypothetical protein